MSRPRQHTSRDAIVASTILGAIAAALAISLGGGNARAEGSPAGPPTLGDSFEPVLGLPAEDVVALGAAPESGETWAYGTVGEQPVGTTAGPRANQLVLLRHTEAAGWQVVPLPDNPEGEPLASGHGTFPRRLGGLGGRVTRAGGVVLLTDGGIVTRDPGGEPQLVKTSAGALLGKEESLPSSSSPVEATAYAAIEEGRHTGILIAPYGDGDGSSPGVLHYDASAWTREPIETPAKGQPGYKPGLAPAAIACAGAQPLASAPDDCWLLAAYKSEETVRVDNRLALFRRLATGEGEAGGYAWREQAVEDSAGALLGEVPPGGSETVIAQTLGPMAQTLTATSQGVWVDLQALTLSGQATDITKLVVPREGGGARVLGTWCEAGEPFCPERGTKALGAGLPSGYRSFAWPGQGSEPGTRIITGLEHRTMLELPGEGSGGGFSVVTGAGGQESGAAPGAAAFSDPQHGWIADGSKPADAADGGGQPQMIEIAPAAEGNQLQEESVPFRRPLYAVAQQPGTSLGDPQAQELAVGERGEIARYVPGDGWQAEALYSDAGKVVEATLRGVAWPEPGRAYAVGDNGTMWVWQAATGLWEPDPAKPLNFVGHLDAIAFSASNPDLGYAVGRQGVLLRFGKSWEQERLPPELQEVNFTSVAFTGPEEAIASYRYVAKEGTHEVEAGGIAIKRTAAEAWHVDPQANALLATLPITDRVFAKVAGLADGGAAAAGPELVIERDAPGGPWRYSTQPLPEAQDISALAAYRDSSGAVRAVVSIELDEQFNPHKADLLLRHSPYGIDVPAPTGTGEPPPFLPPDMVPNSGYMLKETASGWSDMEHETLPAAREGEDLPARPDPVLALLVSPSGESGVAVGGQTGNIEALEPNTATYAGILADQTAAAMRFPAGSASANGSVAKPIPTASGSASFVIAGQAACVRDCADYAKERLGPDVDLLHAIQDANAIDAGTAGGVRAFLYTGGRVENQSSSNVSEFERELDRYAQLLGGASMPVAVAASRNDLGPKHEIGPFVANLGRKGLLGGTESGSAYYEFTTSGAHGGSVDVIVLDFSRGELALQQREWLESQLKTAQESETPAIVVGNLSLSTELPDGPGVTKAADWQQVSQILVEHHASAYFFDYPAANVQTSVRYGGGEPVPAFGTGTLGYVPSPDERSQADALGSSGFLLAEVQTAKRNPKNNEAPVEVRVVPNIAHLAVDPLDGTLLRRSQVALFDALARRPIGGVAITGGGPGAGAQPFGPDPYDPIPFDCLGANCTDAIPTEYTFTSSDPEVGAFVEHDPSSNNPRQVLLGANNLPVLDEPRSPGGELTSDGRFAEKAGKPVNERGEVVARDQSGLFCAYNAGTTTISITTGGLTYSEPITVQAGSAQYPCGTVPLKNRTAELPAHETFKFPEPSPAPAQPTPSALQISLQPPAPIVHTPAPATPLPTPFLAYPAPVLPRPAILPPPPPPAGEPTPPSGTSQVFQTMGAPKEEREEKGAVEMTTNRSSAIAYRANDGRDALGPWATLALVLIAAGAGTGIRRGMRRSHARERPALALASQRQRWRRR